MVELGGIEPPSGKTSRFHLFQAHSCLGTPSRLEQDHMRGELPDCLLDLRDRQRAVPARFYNTRLSTCEPAETSGHRT